MIKEANYKFCLQSDKCKYATSFGRFVSATVPIIPSNNLKFMYRWSLPSSTPKLIHYKLTQQSYYIFMY